MITDLLNRIETAKSGEEATPFHSGKYLKMGVVRVGSSETLMSAGIKPHLKFIRELLLKDVSHFYIVSANPTSNMFANILTERACKECGLSLVFSETYQGRFRRRKRKMFCSLCVKETIGV